jgi:ATP-dependent exoDNAse (exonuclease V) beta subunit
LFLYRQAHHRLHPFRIPDDLPDAWSPIGEALRLLASLHRGRNARPVADTIARLLDATRAHAGFALRPSGEQALANVLHIAELARTYETNGGGLSYRGFVERLLDESDRAQTSEAPILEEGSDGVRIMTVHKAKGLEFPVVVLADITANLTGGASRWIDPARRLCAQRIGGWLPVELSEHEADEERRDAAEGLRVAYVAATRARDLLVVPAVGDEAFEGGWVSCLNRALYPDAGQRRRSQPAPGCPALGGDSVLARPAELAFTVEGVAPGQHRFDDYAVTWWAPGALRLKMPAKFGLRQRELLDKAADPQIVEANLRRCTEWQRTRDAATATARAAYGATGNAAVELLEVPRAHGRPFGPRFGALVHAVLATAPLDAADSAVARITAVQGRLLGADAADDRACRDAVRGALAHPLLDRARASSTCRRETPITLVADDGTLIEGTVDLAFLDGDGWVVVDFKTDQELSQHLDVYRRQVSLYAEAIARATGTPARAVLLRV